MRNREWLFVTACCEQPVEWKTIDAADAPAPWRRRDPEAAGFTVPFCPGCGELKPSLVRGCQPWEAADLRNPEQIERGLCALAPVAARLATQAYLQAIANACVFNEDHGGYESVEDESRVRFEFSTRKLVEY